MWIFDRLTCHMEGENHIYSSLLSTRDQNINLTKYKKIEIVSSCMLINWCYVYIV